MSNGTDETLDRDLEEYIAGVVAAAPDPPAWDALDGRVVETPDDGNPSRRRGALLAVATAVVAVAVVVVVATAGPNDRTDDEVVAAPENQPRIDDVEWSAARSEIEWMSFAAPAELVDASDLVVVVRPADDAHARLLGSLNLPTAGLVDEYWGRQFVVEEVLAGEGLEPGDEVTIVWLIGASTGLGPDDEPVARGGEGFASEVDAELSILGLSRDVPRDDLSDWGVVASAHGLVAFEDVDGTWRVAETAPGSDGYLQRLLAGLTYGEVRAQFLEAAPAAATGGPG